MKKLFILIFSLIIATTISACGTPKDPNILKVETSSDNLVKENYQTVTSDLKTTGFTNIKTVVLEDLITGWITKDGQVKQIDINGKTDFDSGTTFPKDSKIVITYHTFAKAEKSVAKSSNEPITKPSSEVPVKSIQETLTVKNNKDFATLLAEKYESDSFIVEFAKKYDGKTIEFDGNIADMIHHGDYKTRYDILIYAGNYSTTSAIGPSFKFKDVNIVYDLHLTGSNIPETIGVGQNIHITAKVVEYDREHCLFYLEPVSTKMR